MGLVGYQLWRLRGKLKNKVFGAKLTLRLVFFFHPDRRVARHAGLCGIGEFSGQSIESWFDVRVEKALEGGLNLGRNGLDTASKSSRRKPNSSHCCWAKSSRDSISTR